MIDTLVLSAALQENLAAEARTAWPRECCGLLEAVREGGMAHVLAIHPARNLAAEPDRFEIDPAAHIALLRRLRGTGREIVGCYHSHPDGRAAPSARDGAGEHGFVWLIAGVGREKTVALAAFRHETVGFVPLRLVLRA